MAPLSPLRPALLSGWHHTELLLCLPRHFRPGQPWPFKLPIRNKSHSPASICTNTFPAAEEMQLSLVPSINTVIPKTITTHPVAGTSTFWAHQWILPRDPVWVETLLVFRWRH